MLLILWSCRICTSSHSTTVCFWVTDIMDAGHVINSTDHENTHDNDTYDLLSSDQSGYISLVGGNASQTCELLMQNVLQTQCNKLIAR